MMSSGKEQTAAARFARKLAKWRRWAGEMESAGWIMHEPNTLTTYPRGILLGVQHHDPCAVNDFGYSCTLPKGHDDRHESSDGSSVVARWTGPVVL